MGFQDFEEIFSFLKIEISFATEVGEINLLISSDLLITWTCSPIETMFGGGSTECTSGITGHLKTVNRIWLREFIPEYQRAFLL